MKSDAWYVVKKDAVTTAPGLAGLLVLVAAFQTGTGPGAAFVASVVVMVLVSVASVPVIVG
jgi:hypothetical protein